MILMWTSRLVIRDHVWDDLEAYHSLVSDRAAMRYLPEIYCRDMDKTRARLRVAIEESQRQRRRKYFLAVLLAESDTYLGDVGFTITNIEMAGSLAALGYFYLPKHRGHGYATEAAERTIRFGFEEAGIHKIVTGCLCENTGSEQVMIRCGFRKEAHLKHQVFHEGTWKDRVEYGLLREEWAN